MTTTPIMFSGPMVSAILAGRKTQTRRLATSPLRRRQVGDELYVREAWRTMAMHDEWSGKTLCEQYAASVHGRNGVPRRYEADGARAGVRADDETPGWSPGKYRPAMHMPAWMSRIRLVVTDVRVEPLQAISPEDAIAEGLYWHPVLISWQAVKQDGWPTFNDPRRSYHGLWQSLHDKVGQRWNDNPNVVALTFTVESTQWRVP